MLGGFVLRNDGVPIYVQLREQIREAIARGRLAAGTQLPTMRQVAVQLKIDLNTVQRAYAELEREGVLTTARGRGSFVAAPTEPLVDRHSRTDRLARKVAAEAGAQGIALEALAAALARLAGRA